MRRFTVKKGQPITVDTLGQIIQQFQTTNSGILQRRYNYYKGLQKIKLGTTEDYEAKIKGLSRPDNRVVVNWCNLIVQSYEGYCVGMPVDYVSDDAGAEELQEILDYNDVQDEDSELFKQGLIFGIGAEICYVDEEGKKRFRTIDPRNAIPVYDDTLDENLEYAIRFWSVDIAGSPVSEQQYTVEVYSNSEKITYNSTSGFTSFIEVGREPHFFNQVPFTFFYLDTDADNIFDTIIDLQDAYNTLYSSGLNDWQAFLDAYLVIKGALADEEDLVKMKQNRVMMLDADCDAEYLTKDTTKTELNNLLDKTEDKIREIAQCPDFSDEAFGTSSGIALRMKLLGMENKSSAILNNFRKALQRRIELIAYMISMINGEELFRDINIVFTRNLPVDLQEYAGIVNQLKGTVSERTLLSILPFIDDVDKELEFLKAEQEEKQTAYTALMRREEEDGEEDIQI